ncbi:MAG TPA: carboxypeptidase-like regulatory domain-containing protein [Pyrinomonadaceae bacterium]|nr:carboxypeptidase-like regulatory domain-containing protein [Pyrinomonadaceae bacterium]
MRLSTPWYKRTPVIVALIPVLGGLVVAGVKLIPLTFNQGNKNESFIGKVSDTKGTTRIRGAKVSLEGKGLPPVLYTDSEGVFKFDLSQELDEIKIVVEADGYVPFDRRLRVSAKREIEDIRLSPVSDTKANLSGTVLDSHDQPLQGALVTLDDFPGMAPVHTSTDGVFNLSEIPKKYGEGVRVRVVLVGYQPNPYTEDVVLGKAPPIIKLRKK